LRPRSLKSVSSERPDVGGPGDPMSPSVTRSAEGNSECPASASRYDVVVLRRGRSAFDAVGHPSTVSLASASATVGVGRVLVGGRRCLRGRRRRHGRIVPGRSRMVGRLRGCRRQGTSVGRRRIDRRSSVHRFRDLEGVVVGVQIGVAHQSEVKSSAVDPYAALVSADPAFIMAAAVPVRHRPDQPNRFARRAAEPEPRPSIRRGADHRAAT